MKSKTMTAPQLRIALCICLVLVTAAGVAIFQLGHSKLNAVAHSVAETGAKADASQDDLQRLGLTKNELAANSDAVQKASEIAAESKSYQYQNQIVTDINRFAKQAGITITAISFANTTSTAAPATTAPAAATPGANPGGAAATPGLKTISTTISVKSPLNYKKFLQFVHDIEQNLTKMQLQSLSLSKSADGGISSDNLTIEVYIR